MKKIIILLVVCFLYACWNFASPDPTPASSKQLILVITNGYDSTSAHLSLWTRDAAHSPWTSASFETPVVVGRSGIAWGNGLQFNNPPDKPQKQEGDGRSPAGVFELGTAFGIPPKDSVSIGDWPYIRLNEMKECVDDAYSKYYNSIVENDTVASVDWASSEKMYSYKVEYHLGLVVKHNMDPRKAGNGSCIFLHIWAGPDKPTSGCTAMPEEKIKGLLKWLKKEDKPVLVQLPKEEYYRFKGAWHLPEVSL